MLKEVELCVQQEEKIQRRARKNDQLLRDRKGETERWKDFSGSGSDTAKRGY